MGGCFVLLLPIILVGAALFLALLFALPVYAAFALIACIVLVLVARRLAADGIFSRYAEDDTWRRYAALTGKWLLWAAVAYFAISGIVALALTVWLMS